MEIKTETDSSDSAKCSQDGDQCAGSLVRLLFLMLYSGDAGVMLTGPLSAHPLIHRLFHMMQYICSLHLMGGFH